MAHLSDLEVEQLFAQWQIPAGGRELVRKARKTDVNPVRKQQHLNGAVRTLYMSQKMGRGLMAESRTCELPGLYIREHDPCTQEMWPQPFWLSIPVDGEKGSTTVSHLPDLLLITDEGFVVEEWREEERLQGLASKRPHRYYKDEHGKWHDRYVEAYLKKLGIKYFLRSADEHPRIFLTNLDLLADFSLENTPPVSEREIERLQTLLTDRLRSPYLELLEDHGFKPEHVLQSILAGHVYVDLHNTLLREVDELYIYRDQYVILAERLAAKKQRTSAPGSVLDIEKDTIIEYSGVQFRVLLVGKEKVSLVNGDTGEPIELKLSEVRSLHERQLLAPLGITEEDASAAFGMVLSNRKLVQAAKRLAAFERGKAASGLSERTWQRFQRALKGKESPQDRLRALEPKTGGNSTPRLPKEAYELATKVLKEWFNTPKKPTLSSAFSQYVHRCTAEQVHPMSRTRFFEWARPQTDTRKREGKRRHYATEPIPLTFDYASPVHGFLPHQVVYCDHTPLNIVTRGKRIPRQKRPVLTVMVDGSNSGTRAFFLSFRAAGVHSVFMCLRDYVRRWGVLPRVLVLDNGKEFHSRDLMEFCKIFGITIRWRRSGKPRDSGMVERCFGVTETEMLQQMDGNSIHMKNVRAVSPSHYPEKRIKWTLGALYNAFDHFLFDIHRNRIHPRLGISPAEMERQIEAELGTRSHRMVRYDDLFKLLTSPRPRVATRKIDPLRGIFVEGAYYWHECFREARWVRAAHVDVRLELWNAEVVYALYKGDWVVARSRQSSGLKGRFRPELAAQVLEGRSEARSAAAKDRFSPMNAGKHVKAWDPELWDDETRDAMMIEHALYARLGMVEALPSAANHHADVNILPLPQLGWDEAPEDVYEYDDTMDEESLATQRPDDPEQHASDTASTTTSDSSSDLGATPERKDAPAPAQGIETDGSTRPKKSPRKPKQFTKGAPPNVYPPPKQPLNSFIADLDGDAYF